MRHSLRQLVVVLAVAAALAPASARAQEPADAPAVAAQGAAHDLRIELSSELLLAELRTDVRLTVTAGTGERASKLELRHQSRIDFVDELLSRDTPAAGDLDVRRTFVSWEEDATEGRGKPEPSERCFGGTSALVTLRGGELGLELVDRYAPNDHLEDLLAQSASVTWLALPESARVGESFEVEPLALTRLLVGEGARVKSARGRVSLLSVDADGIAALEGPLDALMQDDDGRGTFEGTLALALDTRAHVLRSAQWNAKALLVMGEGAERGDAKGTLDARLALSRGEPARAALGRRPVYRDVPHALSGAPVRFALPSHWYPVEGEEGRETFRTSVHGAEALVTLELSFFDLEGEFEATVDSAVAEMRKQVRLRDVRSVPSPLGKGRSTRYERDEEGGGTSSLAVELYPCGKGRLMKVALGGPPAAFEEEFRAWQKVLRSFELTE